MSDEHVMDLVVVELVLFLVENLVVAEDRVVDIVQEDVLDIVRDSSKQLKRSIIIIGNE